MQVEIHLIRHLIPVLLVWLLKQCTAASFGLPSIVVYLASSGLLAIFCLPCLEYSVMSIEKNRKKIIYIYLTYRCILVFGDLPYPYRVLVKHNSRVGFHGFPCNVSCTLNLQAWICWACCDCRVLWCALFYLYIFDVSAYPGFWRFAVPVSCIGET